ncbi:MAG: hypothetical protein NZ533_06280 [Casimicrobiaceae bacterium]|nr:hypothetical protein [Casimicrobiaceae bacterium]MCX8098164.1 hypothetical protein [Casimicrobiaceae bacterium]MDW8312788.1 hypothetical protein [Burkholderiales bacterium]
MKGLWLVPPIGVSRRRSPGQAFARLAAGAVFGLAALAWGETGGYFGGLRLEQRPLTLSFSAPGLKLGQGLEFGRSEPGFASGTTAFGGYRFESGMTVGAAITTQIGRFPSGLEGRRGVGLYLDPAQWSMVVGQQVQLDVVSAFSWRSSWSLYGRLGVGRGDLRIADPLLPSGNGVERTQMSYGLGLRYDLSPSLGLKLEMRRGLRSPWERLRAEPEGDSILFGLRWVF